MKERPINILKLVDRYAGIAVLHVLAGLRAVLALIMPQRMLGLGTFEVRTIVMVKLWGVGNLVMIIPLIRAVRARYPGARIHFLTLDGNADLLRTLPELDGITTLKTGNILSLLAGVASLPIRLRRLKPDLFLDFEQFLKLTPIAGLLSGAAQRVGLNTPGQARALLYSLKVPYRSDRHMTRTFGDVVRSAGVDTAGFPSLEAPRNPEAARAVKRFLAGLPGEGSPLVAVHLGSGDNFPARRWPVERFAAVAETIHEQCGARIVLTGTSREIPLAEKFGRACRAPFGSAMGSLNLLEFVELLARVDLLISNDTAPVHIASALQRPLIAIYGPNSPDLYGPLNEEARAFTLRFPCSPCITNLNAKTSSCRLPACILDIDSARVAAAAIEMLKSRERGGVRGEAALP